MAPATYLQSETEDLNIFFTVTSSPRAHSVTRPQPPESWSDAIKSLQRPVLLPCLRFFTRNLLLVHLHWSTFLNPISELTPASCIHDIICNNFLKPSALALLCNHITSYVPIGPRCPQGHGLGIAFHSYYPQQSQPGYPLMILELHRQGI